MTDNSDSDIQLETENQPFTPIPQRNDEASFEPFEFKGQTNFRKQIRIVPKEGSTVTELRDSLKNALQILDRMQTKSENEVDLNFNRNLNNLQRIDANLQQQIDLSKSDKLAQPRNYKIVRKKKFVPYKRSNEDTKSGNYQDRTEVSLFMETSEKIENKKNNNNNNNISTNLNFDNFKIASRSVELNSDDDHNDIDLDQLANSLGFNIEVTDQTGEGEENDSKLVDVSDFIAKDSRGNRLMLGDRFKMLEQLITIAEGDLNNLNNSHKTDDNENFS